MPLVDPSECSDLIILFNMMTDLNLLDLYNIQKREKKTAAAFKTQIRQRRRSNCKLGNNDCWLFALATVSLEPYGILRVKEYFKK